MRYPVRTFFFLFFIQITPASAMTQGDAKACVELMLQDARGGQTFESLVSHYVDYSSIVDYVTKRTDKPAEQVQSEINNLLLRESTDGINYEAGLEYIRGSRPMGANYELWGQYTTTYGHIRRFGVFLTPQCRVYDLCDGALCLRNHLVN